VTVLGYRSGMTSSPLQPTDPAPEEPEAGLPDDPTVEPSDAGMPSSPDLDDDNVVVTPPNADDVPGSAAG
jgi:hypothetical protein